MEKRIKNIVGPYWHLIRTSCTVLLCSASILGTDELDTTRVREVSKLKKSIWQLLTEVPGESLKLPVRAVQVVNLPQWNGEAV